MLFALDVGNSHIAAGVFLGDELAKHWRISTDRHKTEDEYGMMFFTMLSLAGYSTKEVSGAVVASVVPPLTPILEKAVGTYLSLEPLVIGPGTKTGMNIRYENPKEVGPDRIANGVATFHKYGGPAVVVDFGTGTTFDAISGEGEYLGGAIAPGILTASDALFESTARLPRVELVAPKTAIGRSTVASMQSGIIFGFAGQVDGVVRRISRELGGQTRVIATGELAHLVAPISETIDLVDPNLTLEGLNLIYRRNVKP